MKRQLQWPAWKKELEKRELDEVFPGKCKSNSDETRRIGKINKMFEKLYKIREMCLAKVELLDWHRRRRRRRRKRRRAGRSNT